MELNEIMRSLWQALLNVPEDAPGREEAVRAYGHLTSRMDYVPPELVLTVRPDGYTEVSFAESHRTYGDWSELAGRMKDKAVDDPVLRATVNYSLKQIYEGGPEAEEAERWMVKTAEDLGVK